MSTRATWAAGVAAAAVVAASASAVSAAPATGDDDSTTPAKPAAKQPAKPAAKKPAKPAAKKPAKPVTAAKLAKPAVDDDKELEIDGASTPAPAPAPSLSVKADVSVGGGAAVTDGDDPDAKPLDDPGSSSHVAPVDIGGQGVVEPERKERSFYVRIGVAELVPLSTSKPLELENINGPASLVLSDGPIAGSGAKVDPATIFAAIIGWRFPHHPHLSLETILGAPVTVKFESTGTLANQSIAPTALGIPTGVGPLGPQLGEAKAAPPVVTIVDTFSLGRFRPYAGIGASVMFTYDAKATNPTLTADGQPYMHVSPAPGLVLQGGFDLRLTERVFLRADVKFIALMHATATVEDMKVSTPDIPLFGEVEVGTAKMQLTVNPIIAQLAAGFDF